MKKNQSLELPVLKVMTKEIDVIINAYNAINYLEDALKSLNTQTIKNLIRITIINDGDDNDYASIIDLYKDSLDINYIKLKKNRGIGIARNIGLKKTFLPYLTFLDSDDVFFDKYSLEKLYNLLKKDNKTSFVYGTEKRNFGKLIHFGNLHGKMYKRSVIDKHQIKFPKLRYGEDAVFNLLYISMINEDEINYTEDYIYIWNDQNQDSLTHIYKDMRFEVEKYLRAFKKFPDLNKKKKISSKYAFTIIEGMYTIYNYHQEKLSPDDLVKFFRACNKLYQTFKTGIDIEIRKNKDDLYYLEIEKFISTFDKY